MIIDLLLEYGRQIKQVETLGNVMPNKITKVNDNGFYVETNSSRGKYKTGKYESPYVLVKKEWIVEAWEILCNKRQCTYEDFKHIGRRQSFIMAFFVTLPFIEEVKYKGKVFIQFKKYQTDDLPSERYQNVIEFLNDIVNGKYDPDRLSQQIQDDKIYRLKSRTRLDLRILGFLNEDYQKNHMILQEYSTSPDKTKYLRELMLKSPYLSMVFELLKYLKAYSLSEKRQLLIEVGRTVVYNSRGDNLMVESVASERTRNLLTWFKNVGLIDEKGDPIELGQIRDLFIKIMNTYLDAKRDPFSGHPIGSVLRRDLPDELNKLSFIQQERYLVRGSVGMGNWAFVPWLAIMDNKVTTTTQEGYYIVYLFSEDMKRLYLTLAQGVTESSRDQMAKRKNKIRNVIQTDPKVKKDNDIQLGDSQKAKQYEFSTALYIKYELDDFPSDQELINDLEKMIGYYQTFYNYDSQGTEEHSEVKENQPIFASSEELIDHIHTYISGKGFFYSKENIMNLYLSLKTKPFVILSGISGTGKTQIVRNFAESLGATVDNGRLMMIPVRPDWSDGSDLLGYTDLKGKFNPGPLTILLQEASKQENRDKPYFILLDEMNLARVEYYFSDLLSIMESREWKGDQIVTDSIRLDNESGKSVSIPDNVYMIGTVNMDETTHPFSQKVLDRANAIEFNDVKLDDFSFFDDETALPEPVEVSNVLLRGQYIRLQEAYSQEKDFIHKVTEKLVEINSILSEMNASFGYRIRDEICFYMIHNKNAQLLDEDEAFDFQIHQKILPRLTGSNEQTYRVLKNLYQFCTNRIVEDDQIDTLKEDLEHVTYPKSASKLADMIRRQFEDGFTSFWF
ncbi:MrcB family domain-containing protein [Pueribacillus sp. YX66]|uniref:MrcB family domain-containing protein n=1 Tax=Pueribacillus sp. YX66 TaxID=3229242 RepID=UPI00358D26E4